MIIINLKTIIQKAFTLKRKKKRFRFFMVFHITKKKGLCWRITSDYYKIYFE